MVGGNSRGRGHIAATMRLLQLIRLELQLVEVRTGGKSSSRHTRSFRERPVSACGPKEAVKRIECTSRWDSVPFRGRAAACAAQGSFLTRGDRSRKAARARRTMTGPEVVVKRW